MNTNSNKLMTNEPKRFRLGVIEWVLIGGIVLCIALLLVLIVPRHAPVPSASPEAAAEEPAPPAPAHPSVAGKPPQEWGIEVVGLYPAVGGRVLDLRYKILDTAKAAVLPNEAGGIYLIDEATGVTTKLPNSPKTGSIPQNPQKLEAGRTYSFSFPNQGNSLKSGSKVTLVIGSFRAENLAVQ